jgi:hypothetical protein
MGQGIQSTLPVVETPGPPVEQSGQGIRTDVVYVVHTSIEETLAAVRVAAAFAKPLGVPVTLVHVRTVPYPLAVDEPPGVSPITTAAFLTRLQADGLDVRVRVCLCRDARRAIPSTFRSHSLIVVAGRRRWWPTESERWRRMLEADGHFVVFVDKSEHKERSHA